MMGRGNRRPDWKGRLSPLDFLFSRWDEEVIGLQCGTPMEDRPQNEPALDRIAETFESAE